MPDTPTILHVVQHLKPGGLENLCLDLVRFTPNGCDAQILSLEGQKDAALSAWPKLQAYAEKLHFMDKPPGLLPSVIPGIMRVARQIGADVIHSHHLGPLIYSGPAARLGGFHLVHTEHNAWHLQNSRARLKERLAVAISNPVLVADAKTVANDLEKTVFWKSPLTIMNGIDTNRFRPLDNQSARAYFDLPQDRFLIGCAARLEPVKGHHYLISALSSLPDDCDLVLAGDGYLKNQLLDMVKDTGLTNRVHFLGAIDDMPRFYNALSVFCLPSMNEGLPLSLLEAQACSKVAISSNVGGCSEAICPDTGHLVPPASAKALAKTILHVKNHPTPIDPRHFVTAKADIRAMAAQYYQLYCKKEA